jgi:outer membrane receptor protein involved in Fe transport
MHLKKPSRIVAAIAATHLAFAPVNAQETPPEAAAAPTEEVTDSPDEMIVLSVFEVTSVQDKGYLSNNTQAGARIAVPIRELPIPISVLNRDLMDDMAITDIFEASRMAPGGEFANRPDNDTNFQFRGITNAYQTRNYFVWYLPTDTYNTERIEVLRGPLGVLYGDAAPGGLLNVVTKRADLKKTFDRVSFRADDNGSIRVAGDANHVVHEAAAVRLNAVWNDGKSWKDFVFNETKAAHLAATVNITSTTTLRVEGEIGEIERNNAANVLVDQYSGLNAAGSTLNPSAGPRNLILPSGVLLLNNNRVGQPASPALGAAAGQGVNQSNGSGAFITDPNALGGLGAKARNWAGASGHENRNYHQYGVFLEQKIGKDLTLELAYNLQDQENSILRPANFFNVRRDPTAQGANIVVNSTVNPASATTIVNANAGRYYIDHSWIRQDGSNVVQDYRATLAYVFDEISFTNQRLVLTAGRREDDAGFLGYNEALRPDSGLIVGGGTASGNQVSNNSVTRRYYLDTDYRLLSYQPSAVTYFAPTAFGFDQELRLRYFSAALPGSFKIGDKNRLFTLLGWRRDHFTNDAIGGAAGPTRNSLGEVVFTAPRSNAIDVERDSVNYGAVVNVTDQVALFANYGESFRPISGVRLDGSPFGAQDGEGFEYGVKLNLWDGRASGTVSIYDITNKNSSFNIPANVAAELRAIFPQLPTGFNPQDSQDVESTGYEVEFQINPFDGWTATFNYSNNEALTSNIAPAVKNLRGQVNSQTNPNNLPTTATDQYLAGLVEPVLNAGVRPEALNFFTRYNFESGGLKGAYIGGGVQWRSETFMGYFLPIPSPTTAEQIKAQRIAEYLPSYTTCNILVGYAFKPTAQTTATVALNVENVLDEDYVNAFARGFGQWGNPRTFILSMTLGF